MIRKKGSLIIENMLASAMIVLTAFSYLSISSM